MKKQTFSYPFCPPFLTTPVTEETVIVSREDSTGEYVDPNQAISTVLRIEAMSQDIADKVAKIVLGWTP